MIWGFSILKWKVPGAFSNSKGFPKDYHLPSQGLTHRHAAPNGPPLLHGTGGEGTQLTGQLAHYCLGDLLFLISDHNLDCFIPMHGFFISGIVTPSLFLIFPGIWFSVC